MEIDDGDDEQVSDSIESQCVVVLLLEFRVCFDVLCFLFQSGVRLCVLMLFYLVVRFIMLSIAF